MIPGQERHPEGTRGQGFEMEETKEKEKIPDQVRDDKVARGGTDGAILQGDKRQKIVWIVGQRLTGGRWRFWIPDQVRDGNTALRDDKSDQDPGEKEQETDARG